jgi:4-amino-4-deoxy-L-arabinose transferase-like glycosyltransferase
MIDRWLVRPAESSPACVALLLGASLFLFFYGLNATELWRTESLRAIIAQQMLDSGNWIVPRLYGEPLFTKPPGMYAAIALCSLPWGHVTDFTARLPSALAATGCVLLFWWYFKRQLGRVAGLAAGLILPMSPMWLDKASSAEIDTLQVFWVTASLICLFRATEDENTGSAGPFGWWLAALLCVAGGFLTKWTAPEFFYGTAIPFLWWRGRLRSLLSPQHLVCAAIASAVCLAWVGAAVGMEGWDVFWATVEREGGDRLIPSHDGRPYPWLGSVLHPARLVATVLPWSALALVTLKPGFAGLWDVRGRRLLQALHCWVWPNLLFWSLPTEHAARHSFPLFPGLAGLAAMAWLAFSSGNLTWKAPQLRPVWCLWASVGLWIVVIGFAIAPTWLPASFTRNWSATLGMCVTLCPLVIGLTAILCFTWDRWRATRPVQVLGYGFSAWFVLKLAFVHGVMPDRCADRGATAKGALIASLVPLGDLLYLFRLKDEGIMFYYGRPVLRLGSPHELPAEPRPVWCILTEEEWRAWSEPRGVEAVQHLRDEQGARLVLVRVSP